MPKDVYKKLAKKLDQLPNRYPATESGVELRLLEKIFSPEQAVLAAEMSGKKEPASVIAERANMPVKETKRMLKGMVRDNLILFSKGKQDLEFGLMPHVFGFYELFLPHLDQEAAELMEQYIHETNGEITGNGLSIHRVIPVQESIDFEMEIFPYEKASDLINKAKSWGVRDCICRTQKALIGDPCDHPVESCMVFGFVEGAFDNSEVDRAITKEEAFQILHEAEAAGMVHTTGNYQEHNFYICNCCTCSCGILRTVAEFNNSTAVTKSDFEAVVDQDLCLVCGDCLERCQFNALDLGDTSLLIDSENCVGCGLCVSVCPENALFLVRRRDGEVPPPPVDLKEWGRIRFQQ
jgi:NAD-dependent dihydropyrimidine dehydrogenase PreA subunit